MPRPDSSPAGPSDDDSEDVRLMRLVGQGDTAAFEQLIERHQSLVIGTVARMLGSNSEVEDIAQQVFVRVWKSAGRYVARAKFTTWLLKITRNLVFIRYAASKRYILRKPVILNHLGKIRTINAITNPQSPPLPEHFDYVGGSLRTRAGSSPRKHGSRE